MNELTAIDAAKDALANDSVPLCGRCFVEVVFANHYCHDCGFPTGDQTMLIPFVRIHGIVQCYVALWRRYMGREITGWKDRLAFLIGGLFLPY